MNNIVNQKRVEMPKNTLLCALISLYKKRRDAAMFVTLSFALLFITACPGSSSNPVAPTPNDTVYMERNSSLSTGNTLAIDIKCNNITGSVYGAAFDVDFDSAKVTYSDKVAGDFLESGSNSVIYLAGLESGSTKKLKVGVTRQGQVTGQTGSGTLVTLKFNVVANASGSSSVSFSNYDLKDSANVSIPGITWTGVTVTVQ